MIRRILEPEMRQYLDNKLKNNGVAIHALQKHLPRNFLVEAAKACVGITEATGRNDGKFIRLIQETVGGASGEPYCAAGLMTILAYTEEKCIITSSIPATELAQDIWYKTPKINRVKNIPLPGAFAVWADMNRAGKQLTTGHTEMVYAADEEKFFGVGFNTSGTTKPGGEVNRDGNGVFFTVRSYNDTQKRKLLGFIKPFA